MALCYNIHMSLQRQVFLNSDGNGIDLLVVAVYSLLKHAVSGCPLHIFIAHDASFSARNGQRTLCAVVSRFPFARLTFLDATPLLERHAKVFSNSKSYWSPIIWAAPLCTELLPPEVCGNLVYLDLDEMILTDLEPLYSLDLASEGMIAAAVNESRREHRPYLVETGWPEEAGYAFNNATMVVDLDAYRRADIPHLILDWFSKHCKTAICVDQDAQNAVLGTRTKRLPLCWNYSDGWLERGLLKCRPWAKEWRVHPKREVLEAILNPKIVHFVGRNKPLYRTHRPERHRYLSLMRELGIPLRETPCRNEGRPTRPILPAQFEGYLFDIFHGLLRAYARILLRLTAQ